MADSPVPARAKRFQFASLKELCQSLGATNVIKRLLIANNGLAAVKGIDSIRSWLYDHIGDAEAVQFVVMATPEDLKANAEFISMADQHVPVPGGPNSNNYANVDLIMHTALQHMCDAIYPGWGHASENPALPRECDKSKRVVFLGPSEEAMFALGDKIASTIVAQSNGVPTVPWSGDSIRLEPGIFHVDPTTYERAYVTTVEECVEECRRIGFPVMIKASEGGGGKGIRRCTKLEEVKDMFFAVTEEVKGCHVFVMRMLENVRHLEVQLLADCHGNCIAVRTRDCSVQRRHQKIIEEGPAFGVAPSVISAMEQAAIRLAKAVKYCGLGTVEYMYDKTTHGFYFLELNPRIQVEHPVSELISGVNLPAALFCVGLGMHLDRIPEVRAFYNEAPYGTTPIDFEARKSIAPKCHTIAVRVTAEDTDEGFRPTSGKVEEISFKNSKECWGYFSIGSGGAIHQFADSQFGHIFSSGETREEARRGMVLALRNLVIRGEIRTSSAYVLELLETPAFCECNVSTAWLDERIAKREDDATKHHSIHAALVAVSVYRNLRVLQEERDKYTSFLAAGHVPSVDFLSNEHTESYVCRSEKFQVSSGRVGPSELALSLNGSVLTVPYRTLKSGALHLTVAPKPVIAYVTEEPNNLRVTISGKATNFTGDIDPTKILTSVPGRLVRYVIENGGHVNEGGTFAEVEVMKMILPIRASTTGVLHHRAVAGSTIAMGTLLAEITPDDPSKVHRSRENKDPWPPEFLIDRKFERPDAVTRVRRAGESLWNMLCGFHFSGIPLDERLSNAFDELSSLFLSSVTLRSVHLPFLSDELVPAPPSASSSTTEDIVQTPTEKLKTIFTALLTQYLEIEKPFDSRSRQETIESLRDAKETAEEVYEFDFAHSQECHDAVVKQLLVYLEGNHQLLKAMQGALSKVVELKSYSYGSLLLQARYLLRQSSLPSFHERKAELVQHMEAGALREVVASSYGYDLLCAIMFDRQMSHLVQVCLELFIRREHFGGDRITALDVSKYCAIWCAGYTFERHVTDGVILDDTVAAPTSESGTPVVQHGICLVFPDEQSLHARFDAALTHAMGPGTQEASIVNVFLAVSRSCSQSDVSALCGAVLEQNIASLHAHAQLKTVYFMVHGMPQGPHGFTFRRGLNFKEFPILRNVLPQSVQRLEMHRLANYEVSMYPTPFKDVHVFKANPKKPGASQLESRMFARVAVTPYDMNLAPWTEGTEIDMGHMLTKCLSALQVARDDVTVHYPPSNHIFIKMIELTFNVRSLQRLLAAAANSYQYRLAALGVREVELSFSVRMPSGLIPMRVVVGSPTGYGLTLHVYYETIEKDGTIYLHRAETSEDLAHSTTGVSSEFLVDMIGGDRRSSDSVASPLVKQNLSKLEDLRSQLPAHRDDIAAMEPADATPSAPQILEAYPVLSATDVKRLQAQAAKTTYAPDWLQIFRIIVRKDWTSMRRARDLPRACVPRSTLHSTQLFLDPSVSSGTGGTLVSEADLNTKPVPCGMLVWMVEYAPPSYFDLETMQARTRRFVLVANDITFQSGSFAVPEDDVFKAASELARRERLPFVYISANSGARIGLAAEVKKRFLVAFTPAGEIDYLYLTPQDYQELTENGVQMDAAPITVSGDAEETRYVVRGIVGGPSEFIGVENLSGSGLVAGEMSKNYSEIPTVSIVTGRSVGIGAYLNRLGRRIIQTDDSPLILTGANALNRLLGKDVYMDNSQLGGKQVMVPNGVTHWNTKHDYASGRTLLAWLDFVPEQIQGTRCVPHRLTTLQEDPIDRDVTFTPEPSTPYDPRLLVTGFLDKTGLFDKGSWQEALSGWAKSVVTGRATLGGIPCGVILVETRLTKKLNPADPADPTSASSFVAQAGQVWFPDSARKTADALDDFQHERLPCFIMANWRGFSGGMRDMFDEVLKFGASIVDNLRVYVSPVFIYIPPFGELRGGAWVVVDPVINHNGVVEMYCDPTSRGGILEASGVAEIKFRDNDVRDLIRRSHPEMSTMDPKVAREEESRLLPKYRDVAVRFADLHDNYVRMTATGVVRDVIPWKDSRRLFHAKLLRKLRELDVANDLVEANVEPNLAAAVRRIQQLYSQSSASEGGAITWGRADEAQLAWLDKTMQDGTWQRLMDASRSGSNAASIAQQMRKLLSECRLRGTASLNECIAELLQDADVADILRTGSVGGPNDAPINSDIFSDSSYGAK